jgi:hypothetical protein
LIPFDGKINEILQKKQVIKKTMAINVILQQNKWIFLLFNLFLHHFWEKNTISVLRVIWQNKKNTEFYCVITSINVCGFKL